MPWIAVAFSELTRPPATTSAESTVVRSTCRPTPTLLLKVFNAMTRLLCERADVRSCGSNQHGRARPVITGTNDAAWNGVGGIARRGGRAGPSDHHEII